MEKDILAGVISGIISGVFLILFERLLAPKNENNINNNSDEVIKPREETSKTKEIVVKTVYKYQNGKSEDNSSAILICSFFLIAIALMNYIKYGEIVHRVIITVSISVGIMAVGMACFCVKKGIHFRKDLNVLLLWNMLALITVPTLIWKTIVASKDRGIDMEILRIQVNSGEGFSIFDANSIFLIYQILGLLIILAYMITVFISNIYLISLLNLNLNSKLRKIWVFLNQKTYSFASNPVRVIILQIIFLLLSYLMVSGIVLDMISA